MTLSPDTGVRATVRAKNIMLRETGFINQTDYWMSQALTQTRKNNGFEPLPPKMKNITHLPIVICRDGVG